MQESTSVKGIWTYEIEGKHVRRLDQEQIVDLTSNEKRSYGLISGRAVIGMCARDEMLACVSRRRSGPPALKTCLDEQVGRFASYGFGNAANIQERHVSLAPFDLAHMRTVNRSCVSQRFLR